MPGVEGRRASYRCSGCAWYTGKTPPLPIRPEGGQRGEERQRLGWVGEDAAAWVDAGGRLGRRRVRGAVQWRGCTRGILQQSRPDRSSGPHQQRDHNSVSGVCAVRACVCVGRGRGVAAVGGSPWVHSFLRCFLRYAGDGVMFPCQPRGGCGAECASGCMLACVC